ncbi:MAG: hypothetical protein IKO16_00650 [Lachnospiraceae bacterium]|nr:hypothetical protein [Lachnospiraceae bacterium]
MKKKIMFVLSPVILAVITLIWLFYKDGRWYYYRQEWQWTPLFLMHLLFPAFYLVMLIVSIIRHAGKDKRSSSGLFYIISSIIMMIACSAGLLLFLIFTSGV